ncbi:MAG: hypothetical protein EBU93_02520 [Chlamydiae bacterium]|nr:hypothetical protein [Chlamydiota bacterium]
MTSIQAIQANQQNALKSTGPKSLSGKAVASRNAQKHGILTKHLVIQNEDSQDLTSLVSEIMTSLLPEGKIEEILVEKIISSIWRLQRLIGAETALFKEKNWIGQEEPMHEAYSSHAMASMSRYESCLERNFYKALHELQRLQAMRLGQGVMMPIAIDIHSEA